jgi:hypothetical protein
VWVAVDRRPGLTIDSRTGPQSTPCFTCSLAALAFSLCVNVWPCKQQHVKHQELAVPSDLSSIALIAKKYPEFMEHAPALYYTCIMGKDGPFRDALVSRWKDAWSRKSPKSKGSLKSLKSKVVIRSLGGESTLSTDDYEAMISILARAFFDTLDGDCCAVWAREVNRKNTHYSGWKNLLSQRRYFGIVARKSGGGYRVVLQRSALKEIMSKLSAAHKAGLMLNSMEVPETMKDYVSECQRVVADLKKSSAPGINVAEDLSYSLAWLMRSHTFAITRAKGITRLKVSRGLSTETCCAMFPDQKDWAQRYFKIACGYKKSMKIVVLADFMRALGYTGPPELLTMYFCLFGDVQVLKFDAGSFAQVLKDNRIRFRAQHGVQPHPATLVRAATLLKAKAMK